VLLDPSQAAIGTLEAKLAQPFADATLAHAAVAESNTAVLRAEAAVAEKERALEKERTARGALQAQVETLEGTVASLVNPPAVSLTLTGGSVPLLRHVLPPHVPDTELSLHGTQRALLRSLVCMQRLAGPRTAKRVSKRGGSAHAADLCDDWNYIDAAGATQGSFTRNEMQKILSENEFDASLPVRLGAHGRYVPIAQLAPSLRNAFDFKLHGVLLDAREAMRPAVGRGETRAAAVAAAAKAIQ